MAGTIVRTIGTDLRSHGSARCALGWLNPRMPRASRAVVRPHSTIARSSREEGAERIRPGITG